MKIEVVTLFPRMIAAALEFGIVGRAIARGLMSVGDRGSAPARDRRASHGR